MGVHWPYPVPPQCTLPCTHSPQIHTESKGETLCAKQLLQAESLTQVAPLKTEPIDDMSCPGMPATETEPSVFQAAPTCSVSGSGPSRFGLLSPWLWPLSFRCPNLLPTLSEHFWAQNYMGESCGTLRFLSSYLLCPSRAPTCSTSLGLLLCLWSCLSRAPTCCASGPSSFLFVVSKLLLGTLSARFWAQS